MIADGMDIQKKATARLMDRRQTTKDEEIRNRQWFLGLKERANDAPEPWACVGGDS